MRELSEITDRGSLADWLEALPQGTEAERDEAQRWAVAIAHRAAMRVLPQFWAWSLGEVARERKMTALPILRPTLISGLAAFCPSPEIQNAAFAAGREANYVADNRATKGATGVAYSASSAAVAAHAPAARSGRNVRRVHIDAVGEAVLEAASIADARAAVWESVRRDCANLSAGEALDRRPLWEGENPLSDLWAETRPQILIRGEGWRFWVEWYDNALHGRAQNYELLTEIALIDDEDWDKGADHVNALIAEIIAEQNTGASGPSGRVDKATTQIVQSAIALNGASLALQLGALIEVADQEIERIRSTNTLDPDIRDGLLSALRKLQEAAREILALMPETGHASEAKAEEIASWGVVLKEQAKIWNTEAKKFVAGQPAVSRVDVTGRLLLASAVSGPLALMGLAPLAAIAGGAILLKGKLDISKAINSIKPGSPSQ